MGHTVEHSQAYRRLQQRLNRNVTGAPDSPVFMQILKLLFSPSEADLARQLPTQFTAVNRSARKVEMPVEALDDILTSMAERGLVLDIERKASVTFPLHRWSSVSSNIPSCASARTTPCRNWPSFFEAYLFEDEKFAQSIFEAETQIGRSLVREEALPSEEFTEILDWERASQLVESATAHAISLCACRHHAEHGSCL